MLLVVAAFSRARFHLKRTLLTRWSMPYARFHRTTSVVRAGEKEVPVGLVAGPLKTGEREHDLPPVGDNLSVRIADEAPMIGVVRDWAGEGANGASGNEAPRGRQAVSAEQSSDRNHDCQEQRQRRAQAGFVVAQIPGNEP